MLIEYHANFTDLWNVIHRSKKLLCDFETTRSRFTQADIIDLADDRLPMHRLATAILSQGNQRVHVYLDKTRIYLAVSILNLFKYKLHTNM